MAENDPTRKERRDAARQERKAAEHAAAASAQRKRKGVQLGAVGLVVAVVAVLAIVISSSGDAKTPKKQAGERVGGQNQVAAMLGGIPQNGKVLGNPNAKVTMLQLVDAQCPVCRQYAEQTLPSVIQNYVRNGKVKLELHEWPIIGQDSVTAGSYIEGAVQQNKGWNYAALFYLHQGQEESGYVTDRFLANIARGVPGLDAAKARRFAQTNASIAPLKASDKLASKLGTDGTPTIAIGSSAANAKKIPGFDYGSVSSALDQALART